MILYDERLFFVHIPKTAGTTIEVSLNKKDILWGRHYSVKDFIEGNRQENLEDWTIFTVVRNPWDRIHSAYQFKNRFKELTFSQFIQHTKNYFEAKSKGEIYYLDNRTVHPFPFPHRLVETLDWWTNGLHNVNYVLRFETLKKDAELFYKSTGFKIDTSLKEQHNPNRSPYREAYTAKERKIVESIYGEEIETFKYSFF